MIVTGSRYVFDGPGLRQRRIEAGLSLADLAVAVGRSVPAVVRYQSSLLPSIEVLLRLSDVLACEPGELFVRAAEVKEQELVRT